MRASTFPDLSSADEIYHVFVKPLLEQLTRAQYGTGRVKEQAKDQALAWASRVLDAAFFPVDPQTMRVPWMLAVAYNFCEEYDRLPTKKELWLAVRRRHPRAFDIGEDMEAKLIKLAGLSGLPQSRRAKK